MGFIRRKIVAPSISGGAGIVRFLFHCILFLKQLGKKKIVPSVEDPLLLKSATLLAEEIREGKIKSEDVVRSYINRILIVEPFINAVVDERFAEAIEEAKTVDALIASGVKAKEILAKEKPLLGVPCTIKVLLGVKGLRCTAGCTIFKDLKAHEDAESVTLMKNSGAICIANTNSPEFGFAFETYNKVHGTTSNPYDTRRTCGGSSGGEGALIASAGSVIGLGNDLGGSVRFPAFNSCIFSHKPTAGLISNKGTFPVPPGKIDEYLAVGPMCRYADDLMTTMKILAGSKLEELKIGHPVDFRKLKIYHMMDYCRNMIEPKMDKEILSKIKKALQHFEETYDNKSKEIQIKGMTRSFYIWMYMINTAAGEDLIGRLTGGKLEIKPILELIKFIFRRSNFTLGPVAVLNVNRTFSASTHSAKMHKFVEDLDKEFNDILDKNAVLIMPTFSKTARFHDEMGMSTAGVGYMAIFNILGYPVTQCPMGLSRDNLPIGFQVVGAKGCDNLTLSVALEIEKAFGGWVQPGLTNSISKEKYVKNGIVSESDKAVY